MAKSYTKIMLDTGTLTLDKGLAGVLEIGFVRGGEFTDGYTVRTIEVDGRRVPIKGEKVLDVAEPVLTINALQASSANLAKIFCGMNIAGTTTKTLTRDIAIVDADYLGNVQFDGFTKDGKAISIKLDNVLAFSPIALSFADKAEVVIPCSFMAHATDSTATILPYSIIIDETA